MTKGILATLALVALGGTAFAADLPSRKGPVFAPVAPIFTWTGFYVGVNAGVLFTDNDIRTSGNAANTATNVALNRRPGSLSISDEAFTIGGQVGYNYQIGNIVLSAEADLNYVDLKSTSRFLSSVGDPSTYRQELDYLGTVRLRIGYAFDRALIYATGGLAYGDVKNSANFFTNTPGNPLQFAGSKSDIEVGYTVSRCGVRLHQQHLAQGRISLLRSRQVERHREPDPLGLNSYTARFRNDGHIVRAGLNYRFSTF